MSLVTEAMSEFTAAGMLAKLTRAQLRTQAMSLVAGGVISSYFGEVSQKVTAAMSQVLRQHGTRLNIRPGRDKKKTKTKTKFYKVWVLNS